MESDPGMATFSVGDADLAECSSQGLPEVMGSKQAENQEHTGKFYTHKSGKHWPCFGTSTPHFPSGFNEPLLEVYPKAGRHWKWQK